MLRMQMKGRLLAGLFALMLLVPVWAGAEEREGGFRPFDRIVVFGTSLSDPGNAFALTGRNLRPQDVRFDEFLIPAFPYAEGGNHFSNGPTWIEQLARTIGLAASVRPAYVASVGGSSNYAVGGARARGDAEGSLSRQVTHFLTDVGPWVPANALYVVEMGGNDIRDALAAGLTGQGDPQVVLTEAAVAVAGNVGRLYAAGARKFLLWRAPNVGRAPAIQFFGPVGVAAATEASIGFNALLDYIVATQLSGLPGIDLVRFDAFAAVEDIVARPAAYGLNDATTACINPAAPPFRCQRPDRHFFWDGIHPTRAGHAIIAIEAGRALIADLLAAH